MAIHERMEIPDSPFFVRRRLANGQLEFEVGPFDTLDEAVDQVKRCPPGAEYVITERGKVIWPENVGHKYS